MKKICSILLLSILYINLLQSQTLDEAKELYKIGEYGKALLVFEKEYKQKPTDSSLNHWYGVCLFETGGDLSEAEKCISFAATKAVQEAYFYLGEIYTKTYRFNLALKEYDRYAKLKRRDKEATERVEVAKKRLQLLQRSAAHPEDIQIIDSLVIGKTEFLSVYKLSPSSGQLEYFSRIFGGSKKNDVTGYFNEKKSKVFYSKEDSSGKVSTLFSMEKLLDDFGNEKKLSSDNFGLSGNLNYPFVMADGVTIYFAGEDKDNLGGYDIYVTRYNMNNDTYLAPERLNTPFNSSFNDYMYVVDEEKGMGWFATDRFQPEGKVCVYTFIPNSKVEIVENPDMNYLVNRSRVTSIKETWKPGADYSSQIKLARKEIAAEKEVKKDFEFIINDKYTYYTTQDFKDKEALSIYKQALDRTNALRELNIRLSNLRDSYSTAASNSVAQEILKLEAQRPKLQDEISEFEIKARNQEIKTLNRL